MALRRAAVNRNDGDDSADSVSNRDIDCASSHLYGSRYTKLRAAMASQQRVFGIRMHFAVLGTDIRYLRPQGTVHPGPHFCNGVQSRLRAGPHFDPILRFSSNDGHGDGGVSFHNILRGLC